MKWCGYGWVHTDATLWSFIVSSMFPLLLFLLLCLAWWKHRGGWQGEGYQGALSVSIPSQWLLPCQGRRETKGEGKEGKERGGVKREGERERERERERVTITLVTQLAEDGSSCYLCVQSRAICLTTEPHYNEETQVSLSVCLFVCSSFVCPSVCLSPEKDYRLKLCHIASMAKYIVQLSFS